MRRATKSAAAVLTAGAVVVVTAPPAHAATYLMWTDEGYNSGYVTFSAISDRVEVCDGGGRDRRVWLRVKNVTKDPDRREYQISQPNNPGGCFAVTAILGQPYNLAEKHCFRFTIWLEGDYADSVDWAQWRNYNHDRATNCDGVD